MSILNRIHQWFWSPVPVHALVANRILLGGALFFCYAIRLDSFRFLYAPGSVAWYPPYRILLGSYLRLPLSPGIDALHSLPPTLLLVFTGVLYATLLVSSLCFALGYRTKTAGTLALLLHAFFFHLNPNSYWGWSKLMAPFLCYTVLSQANRYFSLDALLAQRRGEKRVAVEQWMGPAWPVRLLQIHVCVMYFASISRLDHDGWVHGEMLLAALTNSLFGRLHLDWEPLAAPLKVLSFAVFILEPIAPVVLWLRKVGPWCALSLIAMHLGLELLTNVGWWNYLMIGGLLPFLPASWFIKVFRRFGP